MKTFTRDLGFINFNEEDMPWVKVNGVIVYESWKNLTINGVPPLTLVKSKGVDLIDYKIYGNSIQNGTPTPEAPIEVECVGEKSVNSYDKETYPLIDGLYIDKENGSALQTNNYKATMEYIPIKSNETISINYTASGNRPGIAFYDKNKRYISGVKDGVGFTTPNDAEYMRFTVDIDVDNNTVQINEGSTILDFEPFGYRIPVKISNGTEEITTNIYLNEPLRKIGDYADYVDFQNSKVIRNMVKVLLKEFEWRKHASYSNIYYISGSGFMPGINPLSNIFDSITYQPSVSIANMKKDYCIKMHNTSEALYISDSIHTTLEEFEEMISNSYAVGVLRTPTEETIELPNLPTLKGTTIIEVDTKVQPSNMEVTYKGKGE